eukprot:Gb_26074 [translate_table: standard]
MMCRIYRGRVNNPKNFCPFLLLDDLIKTAVTFYRIKQLAQIQFLPLEYRAVSRPPTAFFVQKSPIL